MCPADYVAYLKQDKQSVTQLNKTSHKYMYMKTSNMSENKYSWVKFDVYYDNLY